MGELISSPVALANLFLQKVNVGQEPGKYVVAVSGGVDSVALLHLLLEANDERRTMNDEDSPSSVLRPPFRFVVAHFDHGIRKDSAEDRKLVQAMAQKIRGLPFVYDEGRLGPRASEATARLARYTFLRRVLQASGARAIVTAHHQDDLLETAIINLLRGTGRKGLTALGSRSDICAAASGRSQVRSSLLMLATKL